MSAQAERQMAASDAAAAVKPAENASVVPGGAQPATAVPRPAADMLVILPQAAEARTPQVAPPHPAAQRERAQVRVAPHVLDLLAIPTPTTQAAEIAREQHDLNQVVHVVLMVGLAISTALMLAGLGLDLVYQREMPATIPGLSDVFRRVVALRPSGFLALGLLVLIVTPILRVIGSIIAFLYEHDWRYAGITLVVLLVLVVSLLLGRG